MKKIALLVWLLGVAPALAANQAPYQTPTTGPMSASTFTATYLNPALLAIGTCNWGPTAPANGPGSAASAYQAWCDTSASPVVAIKIYDGSSWVSRGTLNTSTHTFASVTYATKTDMQTPTSTTLAVNPRDMQDHPGVAKVTARLDGRTGSACTIKESFNLTSCVRNSTGNYTLTFTTGFANTNYQFVFTGYDTGVTNVTMASPTFTSGTIFTFSCVSAPAVTANDCDYMAVQFYGTQ